MLYNHQLIIHAITTLINTTYLACGWVGWGGGMWVWWVGGGMYTHGVVILLC